MQSATRYDAIATGWSKLNTPRPSGSRVGASPFPRADMIAVSPAGAVTVAAYVALTCGVSWWCVCV